ncbi:glycosyltransferase family 2 protein [Nodularia spumigena]|uniref:glycosyltransferase family 2 protein n=1 Tax=Nodularia spumigena TaxID=70799 RepID=UPI00232BBB3C|nr:glycosyltransferase family A protein [Nodularia spumigena]MDB9347422.1 glycosyltransferase family A protein [Nodularia spumigena CS-588/01]MDB9354468.1 glycosyltransferase family A protein [Nodularia spumigena CS-588/05]
MISLVSILIPCYNAEKWIAETIESALAQTWQNKEIIIVDDGSKDNSLSIAKRYESSQVKVIAQENSGASSARNRALKEAQGDFIQYLDADDLLAPNKIEVQIQLLLKEQNCGYIASGEWGRFYKNPSETLFISEPVWADLSPVDWLICSWNGGGMMHPAAWLVPRHIADKAGYWDERLSLNDDGEYFCRVVLASEGVKFCQGAKSYYRSGIENSLSGSQSQKARESEILSWELNTNKLLNRENNSKLKKVCANVFQRFIYDVYPDAPDLRKKAQERVQELGGSDLKLRGSPSFNLLCLIVGWKIAKRIQVFFYRYGYKNVAIGGKLLLLRQKIRTV